MKSEVRKTGRGLALHEFVDHYGLPCSIQESSLATVEAIWFGIDDARPMVMAVFAESVGVQTDETAGWVPYPIPKRVLLHTRMHLTLAMVKALLPILVRFVETGELL